MELWDLYTADRVLTGEEHIRGEKLPAGRYHLTIHAWIINKKGQFLISQRHASRPVLPLKWECVGGSALKGENSLQASLREIKEEVGLDLLPESGKLIGTKRREKGQDFVDIYLYHYDGEVDLSKASEREVAQTKWLYPHEVKALFDQGEMVPSLLYFLDEIAVLADPHFSKSTQRVLPLATAEKTLEELS